MDYEWNWSGAEEEFRRAIEQDPRYATAHQWYSLLLMLTGRPQASLREMELARDLDPLSFIINTSVGGRYYSLRRYSQAIQQYRTVLDLNPDYGVAHFWLGLALQQQKRYPEAEKAFQRAMRLSEHSAMTLASACLGQTYALWGRRREALTLLGRLKERARREYISPVAMAIIPMGLGDHDHAFVWLEKAYRDRCGDLILVKEAEPAFDALRHDKRFDALLTRMGLQK